MRFILISLFSLSCLTAFSQSITDGLVGYFSFDGYPIVDKSGNGNKAFIGGPDSTLGCGVEGNALRFDGQRTDVTLLGPAVFDNFKTGPFTVSFYFKTFNQAGNATLDIVSKRKSCTGDSSFAIRYTPFTNTLSVEVSENASIRNVIIQRLDYARCWQHVVVVRELNKLSLYVNGRLAQTNLAAKRVNITNDAPLTIGKAICSTDRKFGGFIDELRIYDRPLSADEAGLLFNAPDRIANRDTIIFLGGNIKANVTTTCATDFSWSPPADVSDPKAAKTTITPKNGGTFNYILTMKETQCTALDTLTVKVIDPKDLDCGKVFLPKAFTPNADGKNDYFFISNPYAIEELLDFEIVDSWGAKMFYTTDKFLQWDGTFNGKELNPGVYVWKIRFRCKGQELSDFGSVTILK